MAIIWDGDEESVIVEARAMTEDDQPGSTADDVDIEDAQEEEDASDVMRVHLRPGRALAFAKQALEIVAAGRPPCPFCGQPLNPEGHICARRNGFMH
jgi:uncharacterized repeat protein (TIGR03847 family)